MMENIESQTERNRKTGSSSESPPLDCSRVTELRHLEPSASGLPRAHLLTVESISTTTLEFLRHFWSSILPPKPNDTSAFAMAPIKERNARAEKFKGYLEKSKERIRKAVQDAAAEAGPAGELKKRVEAVSRTSRKGHGCVQH